MLITDRVQAGSRPLADIVAAALEGGCRWILVRDKAVSTARQRALLHDCLRRGARYGAVVGISGAPGLAAALGAPAVHLPMTALHSRAWPATTRARLVGVSCHDLDEARRAAAAGADYVTLSPIFPTRSKPGHGPALGLAALRAARACLRRPVIALGGLETAAQVADCLRAGAAGVAVMGAVMRAPDPARATADLIAGCAGGGSGGPGGSAPGPGRAGRAMTTWPATPTTGPPPGSATATRYRRDGR